MSASPLSFLRAGPPPPKVVLLPDGLFFNRTVPVAAGATPAEASAQIELALEAMSPFPLAQLYHGHYWVLGAERAFVYAAYRRRFTTEQTAEWADAELVIPASAALFGGPVQPATTLLLVSTDGITAVHWDTPDVPDRVLYRAIPPEAGDDDRARIREELLRTIGGSKAVVDLLVPPAAVASRSDRELIFRSGDFISKLPVSITAALDVRDKEQLAALRASRQRDLVLWRVVLGCAAALVLLALGEVALVGGGAWQKVRITRLNARAPEVQRIRDAYDLANNIQDLVTKRLLPLEMLTSILGTNAERKPADIVITHVQAGGGGQGLYTLILELKTSNPAQVPVFRQEIQKLPECQDVRVDPVPGPGSVFRMTVSFKPGALKPEPA